MSAQDPYGQQDPYQQGYGQQGYQSYGYPAQQQRTPLDLGKLVSIAAWVVLALYGLKYVYAITQDDAFPDFADRFFYGLDTLGIGIGISAALHGLALWMERNKSS